MQLLGGKRRPPRLAGLLQRYYPQCVTCSGKQSAAVKASRDALVLHYYGIRPWYYAGGAARTGVARMLCSALRGRKSMNPGGCCPSSTTRPAMQAPLWGCGTTARQEPASRRGGDASALEGRRGVVYHQATE